MESLLLVLLLVYFAAVSAPFSIRSVALLLTRRKSTGQRARIFTPSGIKR